MKRKFAEIPTEPLFDMKPSPKRRSGGETSKRPAVLGWTRCPECVGRERVAVIGTGTHHVYRPHDYVTWSGARLECRASGVPLCQLKPKPYRGDRALNGCHHPAETTP